MAINQETNNKYYDLAIYIIGPNIIDSDYILDFLIKTTNEVVVIGDGKTDILVEKDNQFTGEFLSVFSQLSLRNYSSIKKPLVFINAHSEIYNQKYTISLGHPLEVEDLFYALNKDIKSPIDIIFAPCHGGLSLPYINILPSNSKILILSNEDSYSYPLDMINMNQVMSHLDSFSLDIFYDYHLAHLTRFSNPIFVTVGKDIINPLEILPLYLTKEISDSSKNYIKNNFAKNICQESIFCFNEIDYLISKIEDSRSIEDFMHDDNDNYRDIFSLLGSWHQEIFNATSYLDYCPIERNHISSKINEYLFSRHIPLEVNLNAPNWFEEDEDYIYDSNLDGISQRALFDALSISFFNKNNNFPEPAYLEFGKILGITNSIYLSLNEIN